MNRRRMISQRQEDDEMKEWKLLKDVTLEEESNNISIQLDGEYEELNIIIGVIGTDTNKDIANRNAIITFYSSDTKKNVYGYIGAIMMNNGVTRLAHINMNNKPYFNFEYGLINGYSSRLDNYTVTNYLNSPGFTFDTRFTDKINSFKFAPQSGYCGVGSRVIVYGR